MAKENEKIEKSEGIDGVSNDELLAIVEEVVASEEIAKSEKAAEESSEDKGDDLEKSETETAAADESAESNDKEIQKSEDESEEEDLEKGNVSTPEDHGKPEDGQGPGETSDEIADSKKKKQKEKDLGFTDGKADGKIDIDGTTGQGETKEARSSDASKTSYYKSVGEEQVEKLIKSIEGLVEKVSAFEERIGKIEKSKGSNESEDEIRKSVSAEITERVAKSFFSEAEELKKSVRAALEENEELRKSSKEAEEKLEKAVSESEELRKSLKKPASTRQAINNLDAIEKANPEKPAARVYKSKNEVLEVMEELRKSGKVTGDDVISYNASNFMSDKTKKLLEEYK